MKKTFVVIGLGRFGFNVAKTLAEMDSDVLAVDVNEESVRNISKYVEHCVITDGTKFDALNELGVGQIDHAVVAIGNNLQASVLTVVNLKKLNVRLITVRADDVSQKELFYMLGATEVIIPEEASAVSLANQIMSDSILDYYEISKDFVMVKINVGKNFVPKTIIDLNIRNVFNVNIVAIIKDRELYIPHGTDVIEPNDIMVVSGNKVNINKFDEFMNK
ncbi:MAG: TrkA family potassium uptake protein [Acholeplasmatales bacterium]|nr:TrkA family potassium uptake protein [Acholeplasmatales bacterium]